MDIINILNDAGFETVVGIDAVKEAIRNIADNSTTLLCSGYRVLPDGTKCLGCSDCQGE